MMKKILSEQIGQRGDEDDEEEEEENAADPLTYRTGFVSSKEEFLPEQRFCKTSFKSTIHKRRNVKNSCSLAIDTESLAVWFLLGAIIIGQTTGASELILEQSAAAAQAGLHASQNSGLGFDESRTPKVENSSDADELYLSSSGGHLSGPNSSGNHIRSNMDEAANTQPSDSAAHGSKLRIVRLLAPDAVQNGTQNVTLDCMFKFDRKLDQRLTIKWFFNDELEPIYQWIPELNKRVFSDRYEQFLDKSYEVSQDVDFMLQAYRWLQLSSSSSSSLDLPVDETNSNADDPEPATGEQERPASDYPNEEQQTGQGRRQLANRLNKLAKLGGKHSRQLLDSLRSALEMDPKWPEYTRFRALRLIRPTTLLNGRFTCSVSSLEGDDLRSKQLVVYEPASSFTFTVSRVPHAPNQFNLTCQAGQVFPRPALALFRYRAGPPAQAAPSSAGSPLEQQSGRRTNRQPQLGRPKLAATSLRQEQIADTRTHLSLSYVHAALGSVSKVELEQDSNDINRYVADETDLRPAFYDISTWALIDEASLSSYVVTQFECLLSIEGLEQIREPQPQPRLSLALQKGWHVNSAALTSRSTLVGLFSALASLLCLMLAMVSSMLIFRLLKRHAKNRIHDQDKASDCRDGTVASPTIAGSSRSSR